MRNILLILLCVFLYSPLYPQEEMQSAHKEKQLLVDRVFIIRKTQIKSSKAKNIAELIKEYANIDINNKTVYSQSTFILNGEILNNEEKRVYLFLYDKKNIDSIDINYYVLVRNNNRTCIRC